MPIKKVVTPIEVQFDVDMTPLTEAPRISRINAVAKAMVGVINRAELMPILVHYGVEFDVRDNDNDLFPVGISIQSDTPTIQGFKNITQLKKWCKKHKINILKLSFDTYQQNHTKKES